MTTAQIRAAVVTADDLEHRLTTPESLRPWITDIARIPQVRALSAPFTHVPQAVTTLVLRTEASGRRDALVVGPRTRATYASANKPAGCLRLRLAPGTTHSLLGVSAADLTDRVALLADLPGPASALADTLAEIPLEDVLPYLESVLPQHFSESGTDRDHRRLLDSAVAALDRDPAPINNLAATLAVSERQLRNLFTAGIGVSPKHYARITRLRHVLAAAGNTPWSHLASDTGYYDQSHLVADFRSVMGVTPARYFKGSVPAPTPCQSLTKLPR